jgi:SAM-dependent methyltransferase
MVDRSPLRSPNEVLGRSIDRAAIEHPACDVCGARDAQVLRAVRDDLHDLPGEFEYVVCRRCGLIYLSPRPSRQAVLDYYPEGYDCHQPPLASTRSRILKWAQRRNLAGRRRLVLKQSGLRRGRILDIGCGSGRFLEEMREAGWTTVGIEPVASIAELARTQALLDVRVGTTETASLGGASFDVVSYWDVLEHTPSPTEELARAKALLVHHGLLVVSLPNWEGFDRALFRQHWHGFDAPRHLFIFPRVVLARMLREAGFDVVAVGSTNSGYYALVQSIYRLLKAIAPRYARTAYRLLRIPGPRFILEPVLGLLAALGRGPVATYVAQKRTDPVCAGIAGSRRDVG